ncbi:MAG: hypothetical protein KF906_01720 [Actinobacteria bacterium]|nr:hypothetical protein [Actinomycetota bacterium]
MSPYTDCFSGTIAELTDTTVDWQFAMGPWGGAPQRLVERTTEEQRAGASGFVSCLRRDGSGAQAWLVGGGSPADVVPGLTASAEQALVVPVPEIGSSPPQGALMPVGLPVWFWVDNGAALTESAAVPGVSVTVRATVASTAVVVDGPDGTVRIDCEGTGERFDPAVHGAWDRSGCSHVFDRAGSVEVTVSVTWDLSWSATTGASGVLDPVTRSTTVTVQPVELEAVVD